MMVLRVRNWGKHYENNRSRELKRPEWLPLPNKFDGVGFMELLDHPAGISHYGAWCLLLGAASRQPCRGTLRTDSGRALTTKDLSRMTRAPASVFDEAIPRLLAIGWLEEVDINEETDNACVTSDAIDAVISHDDAEIPHPPAEKSTLNGKGNGKGNRTTTTTTGVVVDVDPDKAEDDPSDVVAPQTPTPAGKPPVSFADWVMAGHSRVHMDYQSRELWESLWKRLQDEWTEPIRVMDAMYDALVKTLDQPRFKIWPTNADEWIRTHVN